VYWHATRTTVVSFNYDTIIEAAYREVVQVRYGNLDENYSSESQLYRVPIASPWTRVGGSMGPTDAPFFALLKLHGSSSWLSTGRNQYSGEPVYGDFIGRG
jgi:hypothetical protein